MKDPDAYEAWYHTPRGAWIAAQEFALMSALLRARPGESLLDAGCGTGHFSRRFAAAGLEVTGVDPDPAAIAFARGLGGGVCYVLGDARALPFADGRFDHAAAVTSLCFVDDPAAAVAELWRVARRGVVLGLLNRRSLLYRRKHGRGGYEGARWDSPEDVRRWLDALAPAPLATLGSAVFFPGGGFPAHLAERLLPGRLLRGGFLAVALRKPSRENRQTA